MGAAGYLEYSGIGDSDRFLLDVGFGLGLGAREMGETEGMFERST